MMQWHFVNFFSEFVWDQKLSQMLIRWLPPVSADPFNVRKARHVNVHLHHVRHSWTRATDCNLRGCFSRLINPWWHPDHHGFISDRSVRADGVLLKAIAAAGSCLKANNNYVWELRQVCQSGRSGVALLQGQQITIVHICWCSETETQYCVLKR